MTAGATCRHDKRPSGTQQDLPPKRRSIGGSASSSPRQPAPAASSSPAVSAVASSEEDPDLDAMEQLDQDDGTELEPDSDAGLAPYTRRYNLRS